MTVCSHSVKTISIHAAKEGCDTRFGCIWDHVQISIHAARVGCDCAAEEVFRGRKQYFNPRSPSGLRRGLDSSPVRVIDISIHAARVGCDLHMNKDATLPKLFQSTQPEWAATYGRESGPEKLM